MTRSSTSPVPSSAAPAPDPHPLPSVHTALLDPETLAALFTDLSLAAHVLDVRIKSHVTGYASPEAWTLSAARAALEAGQVSGLQVRYVIGADVWRDTLMSTPDGVRLVRIKEPGTHPR